MIKREQFALDYKISPMYSEHIQQLVADSKVSFQNFQTPGWSSIMHTQNSPDNVKPKQQINRQYILEKLNKLKDSDLQSSNFSKVRIPDSAKNSNILIYEQQKHLLQKSQKDQKIKNNYSQRHSLQVQNKTKRYSESNEVRRIPTQNILQNSKNTQNHNKSVSSLKQNSQISKHQSNKILKRYQNLTVHEHLYLAGIKQNNKRLVEQIVDEHYKKQNILKFQPQINAKSQQLAEVRFSRLKQKMDIEKQLQIQNKKQLVGIKKGKQILLQQRQNNKFHILQRLFYFLSREKQSINSITLKQVIEQLPIMCIRQLQKIFARIYGGEQITWLQFLSMINDKKLIKNKQGLINIFDKWFNKLKKQKQKY